MSFGMFYKIKICQNQILKNPTQLSQYVEYFTYELVPSCAE